MSKLTSCHINNPDEKSSNNILILLVFPVKVPA